MRDPIPENWLPRIGRLTTASSGISSGYRSNCYSLSLQYSSSFLVFSSYLFSAAITSSADSTLFSSFFLFLIFLALTANRIVDSVSPASDFSDEQVVMMLVRDSPFRESFRILVNLEFRQGICQAEVVSAEITLPRHERDRLIFLASSSVWPVTPLFRIFSLPAKSIKQSLFRYVLSPQLEVRQTKSMVWEREEQSLLWVEAILRSRYPNLMRSMTSKWFSTLTSTSPSRATLSAISLIFTPSGVCLRGSNRSMSFSLQIQSIEHVISSSVDFLLKMSYKARGIIPYFSLFLSSPNIVKVLPEPVCPQVKIVLFCPLKNASMCLPATIEQTSDCDELLPNMPSNEYLFSPSSIIVWSCFRQEGQLAGRNLQKTRIFWPSSTFQAVWQVLFSSMVLSTSDSGRSMVILVMDW